MGTVAPAVLFLVSAGCVSYSSLKTARALAPGTWRADVAAGARWTIPRSGLTAFDPTSPPSEDAKDGPELEFQVRHGIISGVDVGLKSNGASAELNTTFEIDRTPRWGLAVAPAIQVASGSNLDDEGWNLAVFKLPVLVGLRLGRHEIVVGPTLLVTSGRGTAKNHVDPDAVLAGGTAGFSFAAAQWMRIHAEVAIFTPVAGDALAIDHAYVRIAPDVGVGRPVLIGASLGFSFGPDRD
jgi:hypothetical protein